MRTCFGVLEQIIPLIPEDHPARKEFEDFKNTIFLELPEDGLRYFRPASAIMAKHFAGIEGDGHGWKSDVVRMWFHGI